MTRGQTGTKYTQPLYLRSRFSLTTMSPLESAGFCETISTSADLMSTLHIVLLILKIFPFTCIIVIFLNKIISDIKIFSKRLRSFD